jgi:hypothetical protein
MDGKIAYERQACLQTLSSPFIGAQCWLNSRPLQRAPSRAVFEDSRCRKTGGGTARGGW